MKRSTLVVSVICLMLVISPSLVAGPPSESGPFVTRYDVDGFPLDGFLFQVDWENWRMAVYGIDVVDFCLGGGELEPVSVHEIATPSVVESIMQLVIADDVTASVWGGTSCTYILNNAPIASGTVDIVSTDNDLLSYLNPDSRRSNAFGFSAHGFLWTPQGVRMRLNAHSRCVWDGKDGSKQNKCNDKIGLH